MCGVCGQNIDNPGAFCKGEYGGIHTVKRTAVYRHTQSNTQPCTDTHTVRAACTLHTLPDAHTQSPVSFCKDESEDVDTCTRALSAQTQTAELLLLPGRLPSAQKYSTAEVDFHCSAYFKGYLATRVKLKVAS